MLPRVSSASVRPAGLARREPRRCARRGAGALALVVATVLAYLPALRAGYVWDDDDYVTNNPLLSAPDGLWRIWFSMDQPSQYFPLVYTSFRLEYALWGLEPFGYHLVNVLLHAANALLLVVVLHQLKLPGAWLAGAIFALHPVHVESVAWITERKNVLSTFFFLTALAAWIRFAEPGAGARARWYGLSLGSYVLALLAKTTACTLPAAQILALFVRGRPVGLRRVAQVLPFFVVGVAMGLLTLWWERVKQGTHGERFEMTLVESTLVASRAVWFYLGKLAWPTQLSFSYPRFAIDPGDLWQYLPLVAGAALLLALWRFRDALGRGPLAAALFFVAMLSPLIGFIPLYTFLYTFVADHYQYVASIGPIALLAGAAAHHLWPRAPRLALGAAAVLLAVLGALTFAQSRVYESSETLWRDVIAKNPGSWMAHANLGRELLREGPAAEALPSFQEAARLRPDLAQPHHGMGAALVRSGRPDEARPHFERALEIDPDFHASHQRLAALRWREGDRDGALAHFDAMVRIAPRDAASRVAHARALAALGRAAEADAEYRAALALAPEHPAALRGLARLRASCPGGRAPESGEASEPAERLVDLRPGDPSALRLLAAAYAAEGRTEDAAALAEDAFRRAVAAERHALAQRIEHELARYAARERCPAPETGSATP
jgi:protein O-mannosyl-transferase